jgi:nicotinate-nucleotide pyrophosphorylase (carboxylating)
MEEFIREDLGYGDITTQLIPDRKCRAKIIAGSSGILAGVREAISIFERFGVTTIHAKKDGDRVKKGDTVLKMEGSARGILSGERVALNFLGRMSGIATLTRKFVSLAGKVKIAGTRKTTPGFRRWEKLAIEIGGGYPHRFDLDDAFLIKDNHLRFISIEKAIKEAKARDFTKKVEVEVESVEDALKAAHAGADIIMFDNLPPEKIKEAVSILEKKKLRKNVILEASGGINLSNLKKYAGTGVDIISAGALTEEARWLDFTLEIE